MTKTVFLFTVILFFIHISFYSFPVDSQEHKFSNNNNVKPLLSFGFDSNVILYSDIKDTRTALESWVTKAAEENDIEQTTQIFSDSKSLLNSIKSGQLNAVCTSSLNYLYLSRISDVEASFGYIRMGKKTEKYIFIVPGNSEIFDITMLKGKKIVLRQADDIAELFLNILLLRNKQEQINTFFSKIIFKRSASQAILSLFFGQADACITTQSVFDIMTELNPQIGRQLKVVAESKELVSVVYCFSKSFDLKAKQKIGEWLINFKNSIRGKQLLTLFQIDGIFAINESDLISIKELLNEYEMLNRKNAIETFESGNISKKIPSNSRNKHVKKD